MATAFALTNAQAALFAASQNETHANNPSLTTNRAKIYLNWLNENESDQSGREQL
jgi:hypothetical protein